MPLGFRPWLAVFKSPTGLKTPVKGALALATRAMPSSAKQVPVKLCPAPPARMIRGISTPSGVFKMISRSESYVWVMLRQTDASPKVSLVAVTGSPCTAMGMHKFCTESGMGVAILNVKICPQDGVVPIKRPSSRAIRCSFLLIWAKYLVVGCFFKYIDS
jgi:hypothetical protein